MTPPISVEIDLSNKCNHNCYYCNSAEYRKHHPDKASKDDYFRLLEDLHLWDTGGFVRSVIFSGGGDPLMNPDSGIIIEKACELFGKVGLVTNGANLSQLESCNLPPTWIGVDIDAADDITFRKIRRGNLQETLSGVKYAMSKFMPVGTKFTMKFLLTEYNNTEEHVKKAIDLAADLGFDEFFIRVAWLGDNKFVIPFHGEDERPSIINYEYLNSMVEDYCISKHVTPLIGSLKHIHYIFEKGIGEQVVKRCFAPLFLPVFGADGSIWYCCELRGNRHLKVGDWIKQGIVPLMSEKIITWMNNFNFKCNRMCRYFSYNKLCDDVVTKLDSNYEFF